MLGLHAAFGLQLKRHRIFFWTQLLSIHISQLGITQVAADTKRPTNRPKMHTTEFLTAPLNFLQVHLFKIIFILVYSSVLSVLYA